jgi:hypothetical protein
MKTIPMPQPLSVTIGATLPKYLDESLPLGDRFLGALKVSNARAKEMQQEIQKGRDEWEERYTRETGMSWTQM